MKISVASSQNCSLFRPTTTDLVTITSFIANYLDKNDACIHTYTELSNTFDTHYC